MRLTFVQTILDLARRDERVWVLTPDMGFSVLEPFQKEFPNRFLNTGIMEQCAIGVAAGLALTGKKVYVYSIIPFVTMRCFEQVRVDLAYMNTDVKLVGVGAGLTYGPAGATHHAIEDIAVMRALPNMIVCCPGDPAEVAAVTRQSFTSDGPMYIRLAKSGEAIVSRLDTDIRIGKASTISMGKDAVVFVTSNMLHTAVKVRELLAAKKVDVGIVSFPTVKPMDQDLVLAWANKQVPVVTLEEHSLVGGFGSAILEVLAENGALVSICRIGIPDRYTHDVGPADYLREKMGLTPEPVADRILTFIKGIR